MIKKTYNIPLHRKIAEGYLKPSSVKTSDIFLEVIGERVGVSYDGLKSEIYSIEKTRSEVIIYANTLGFKITDRYYKNKPLYNLVILPKDNSSNLLTELSAIIGREFLIEAFEDTIAVFMNYTKNVVELLGDTYQINPVYPIFAPFLNNSNIKVKRLRDRLKVSVSNIDVSNISVELVSENLFEPKVHNESWVEFYECVFKDRSNKYIHVYNHSFELLSKNEYQKKTNLTQIKDPAVSPIYSIDKGDYVRFEYDTYRSNLLHNIDYNSDVYFYLNYDYTDKTDVFIIDVKENFSEDLVLLYSITDVKKDFDFILNPYIINKIYSLKGEDYTLMFKENIKNKYNKPDDIRFGNTRVILNLPNLVTKPVEYITDGNVVITQEEAYNAYYDGGESPIPESLFKYRDVIQDLRQRLSDSRSGVQSDGEKNYYRVGGLPPPPPPPPTYLPT